MGMTRINITDDTITIRRSDVPNIGLTEEYRDHDIEAGKFSGLVGNWREFFLNSTDQEDSWLPECEDDILELLGALIYVREVDAEMGVSRKDKMVADIPGLGRGAEYTEIEVAEILVAKGWRK